MGHRSIMGCVWGVMKLVSLVAKFVDGDCLMMFTGRVERSGDSSLCIYGSIRGIMSLDAVDSSS